MNRHSRDTKPVCYHCTSKASHGIWNTPLKLNTKGNADRIVKQEATVKQNIIFDDFLAKMNREGRNDHAAQ